MALAALFMSWKGGGVLDRLAIPVAFIMVLALVAVLVGAPLVPRFTVPGAATLGATLGALPDALDGFVTPRTTQGTDLASLLAAHGSRTLTDLPPGLVGRWAGVMEVYVPAVSYPAAYADLPGTEKARVTIEVDRSASAVSPGGSGTSADSSRRIVKYGSD